MIIQIFFLNLWEKNKSFFISQKFSKLCDGGKSAIVLRALASPLGGKNAAQHWSVFYVLLCLLFYSGELKFGGRFPFNIPTQTSKMTHNQKFTKLIIGTLTKIIISISSLLRQNAQQKSNNTTISTQHKHKKR